MSEERYGEMAAVTTLLSSELDSLANDANVVSTEISTVENGRHKNIMFLLSLASVDLTAQTNPCVEIYLLGRYDGTNYVDGSTTVTPECVPNAVIPLRTVSGAQIVGTGSLRTHPITQKVLIRNKTGVAFAATGTTLGYATHA